MTFFCSKEIEDKINLNNNNNIYIEIKGLMFAIELIEFNSKFITFNCDNINLIPQLIPPFSKEINFRLNGELFYDKSIIFICSKIVKNENNYLYTITKQQEGES